MTAPHTRKIFVNLPVSDLTRSIEFFAGLGFTFDPNFTDENATCMTINGDASVMLLVRDRFSDFTKKQITDTSSDTEAIFAVSAESREAVDTMVSTALSTGGSPSSETVDHGWMYVSSFADPDGHLWEVMWMDEAGVPPDMQ